MIELKNINEKILAIAIAFPMLLLTNMLTNIPFLSSILAGFSYIIVFYTLYELKNNETLYGYKNFPNTLVISKAGKFEAITGVCLNLITTEEKCLRIVRLQNRFSIDHIESQTGSLYLLPYEIPLDQDWETLSEKRQKFYLSQAREHFNSFLSALTELSICVNIHPLTPDELQKGSGYGDHYRVKIEFTEEETEQIALHIPSEKDNNSHSSQEEEEKIMSQSLVIINEEI